MLYTISYRKLFFTFLFIVFACATIGLNSFGLSETSEARYGEIGREMVLQHDYIHPTLLGIRHYAKPPMTYWITSLGYTLFGINPFGARFFLIIALILQLLLIYEITKKLFQEVQAAFYAVLIYFSFPIVLISIHNLTTDAYLNTFILGALYCFLSCKQKNKSFYTYFFYSLLGLGFLTKGPVVLLPIFTIIGSYKFFAKNKIRASIHDFFGTLLFLIISGSWFIIILWDNPKLWDYFIQVELIDRLFHAQNLHRNQPFWYYAWVVPLVGLPLTILLSMHLKEVFRKALEKKKTVLKAFICSVAILLLLFSLFSSKLILYILPIYPLIAIAGGYIWRIISDTYIKLFIRIYQVLFIAIFIVVSWAVFRSYIQINIFYFTMLGIGILLSNLFIAFYKRYTIKQRLIQLSTLFSCIILLTHTLVASENPSLINSTDGIAKHITDKQLNHRQILVYNTLLPSLAFTLNKAFITVNDNYYLSNRNTVFQPNDNYRKYYLTLNNKSDLNRFQNLLQHDKITLVIDKKRPLQDSLQYLLKNFEHTKNFGKWILYY